MTSPRTPTTDPHAASPSSASRWLRRRLLAPAALAAAVGFSALAPAASPASPSAASAERSITPGKRRDEVVDVYERVKGAVVNIHSERTVSTPSDDPFRPSAVQPQRVNGMGTGIVLDHRGYVLTNYHVVDEVNALRVRLHDGTGYTARVVATDKDADLALIKIDPARPLPVIGVGTATDLMVGESVIAIGNAYGYEHTVTAGRVSFKGRDVSLNKEVGYKGLIQTSAPINPGNSGGPLLNVLGELVGVNVAIRAGAQNIGFALPVDFVVGRAAEMIARRRAGLRHGLLVKDAVTREATESPARRTVAVEMVEPGSPAAAAGFKPGDVIDQVDELPVYTSIDLERGFLDKSAGAKVPVKVTRGATTSVALELTLEPGMRAPAAPADVIWRKLGVKVQPVGADVVSKARKELRGGLLVTEVSVGGVAATAGIQKGDVLVGLHQWETLTADNVVFVLTHKDLASFLPLKFYVVRNNDVRDGWITSVP